MKSSSRLFVFGSTAIALLGGVLAGFYPLISAHRDMKRFCGAIRVGEPMSYVKGRAEANGYEVVKWADGSTHVMDSRSVGTLGCGVPLDESGHVKGPGQLQD